MRKGSPTEGEWLAQDCRAGQPVAEWEVESDLPSFYEWAPSPGAIMIVIMKAKHFLLCCIT